MEIFRIYNSFVDVVDSKYRSLDAAKRAIARQYRVFRKTHTDNTVFCWAIQQWDSESRKWQETYETQNWDSSIR